LTTEGDAVCFDDLALGYGFTAEPTTYTVATFDPAGRPIPSQDVPATGDRTCTHHFTPSGAPDGYTIVELTTRRSAFAGRTLVHVARDPASRALRVIGIWRP
jgi:hypothetical protein